MNSKSDKILTSFEEIRQFMGVSDYVLQHFIRMGLPILQINRRWYAHTDNLEEFVKAISRKQKSLQTEENDMGLAAE